jgi:hypothetical protein
MPLYLIEMAENQIGKRIKRLRTDGDGGGEYLGDVTPILQSRGIIHEKTVTFMDSFRGK